MREPLHRLSAVRLAQMIAQGEASSEVVTRSFVDAIRAREKEIQAFAWFDADRAIAVARELHLVSRRGPLHGLPVAIKDNIDTADMPTGYGSIIYEGHRPHCDAACVGLLKNAGAFVIGKMVSAELRTSRRVRRATRTTSRTRPAAPRAALRPRSPRTSRRSRSARRQPAR